MLKQTYLGGYGEDEDVECTKDTIEAHEGYLNECEFVKEECDYESIYNFNELYYCSLDQNLAVFVPVGLLLILLCFYVLGQTADAYLSPALE